MEGQDLLTFQIFTDVVLCVLIVIFLWICIRRIEKKACSVDEKSLKELKKLIDESKISADCLVKTFDESREAFKAIAINLDEKEKKLRDIIDESDEAIGRLNLSEKGQNDSKKIRGYMAVKKLANQGLSAATIADVLNLPEGEIKLILDLSREEQENS